MSLKNFEFIQKLGEGAFSQVYKVKRIIDSQIYALKQVRFGSLRPKEKENALNEVRILASIIHPNIIGYKEAFIDESSNSLCIVMEFADGGDLLSKINNHKQKNTHFPERELWSIFIQMLSGVKALHDLKILHRDLKSANVFITHDGVVKIGDMNISKIAYGGLAHTQAGTPFYASPEVWRNQPYDSKSDIWSLGCILYELTMLNPPFKSADMEGLFQKIVRGHYPPISMEFSNDLSNLIRTLLQVNPGLRPNCEKILEMPLISRNIEVQQIREVASTGNLLSTIKVSGSLNGISMALPPSNYHNRLVSVGALAVNGDIRGSPKSYDLLGKHISPEKFKIDDNKAKANENRLKLAYPMSRAEKYRNNQIPLDQRIQNLKEKSRGNQLRMIWYR